MNVLNKSLENKVVRVGIQAIYKRNGLILLGRRRNVFGDMTWGLPGGQLEIGESIFQCAIRELREETGITAQEVQLACICDAISSSNFYLQIGVNILSATGEPAMREPEYCDALEFFSVDNLPSNLFPPSELILSAINSGDTYLEHPSLRVKIN